MEEFDQKYARKSAFVVWKRQVIFHDLFAQNEKNRYWITDCYN